MRRTGSQAGTREGTSLFYSTRSKLIATFLAVSFLVGGVSLFVGGQLLYNALLKEATSRISLDLNAAREIYLNRISGVETSLGITALGEGFQNDLATGDCAGLVKRLSRVSKHARLDFAGITTVEGRTLCRTGPNAVPGDEAVANPLSALAIERGVPVAGAVVLSPGFLAQENPELAERARIDLMPTPRAMERPEKVETSGMAIGAAIPVERDGEILGVVYGGVLLNRSNMIVDRVRDTVFHNETYDGRSVGTATIFLGDTRISTNVLSRGGKRAIGTRVSNVVRERVLVDGVKWSDRAFVVSDWYITAYEPIEDIHEERVGMLYVGVLEAKYASVRWKALSLFAAITIAGIALAIAFGYWLAAKITRPVRQLVEASTQVSKGNFSPDLGPISKDEIGILQKTFSDMAASLRKRDRLIQAESERQLLRYEKEASVGRLAAGVAHEINNPLTGVLTFTHMMLRRKDIDDSMRSDLERIAEQTERVRKIVKGLLDFSRQTKLDREPTDINRLIRTTLTLVENQALVRGVSVVFKPGESLPDLVLDRNQMQSVLLNILINALDAMQPGDAVTIRTVVSVLASKGDHRGVEVAVTDTGCGIPPEHLDKLFDPFFTTKDVGEGTGLGLAVSYGIVERHGGNIRVRSEVGLGSTFTIWLPANGKERKNEDPRG